MWTHYDVAVQYAVIELFQFRGGVDAICLKSVTGVKMSGCETGIHDVSFFKGSDLLIRLVDEPVYEFLSAFVCLWMCISE